MKHALTLITLPFWAGWFTLAALLLLRGRS